MSAPTPAPRRRYFTPPAAAVTNRESRALVLERASAAQLARRLHKIGVNLSPEEVDERLRLQRWALDKHVADLNRIDDWRLGYRPAPASEEVTP